MSDQKVVSIFDKKKEKAADEAAEKKEKSKDEMDSEAYFQEVQAANKAKAEKIRKEKLEANKGVLRSYRIKS